MTWPLEIPTPRGRLLIPARGLYALAVPIQDEVIDDLLDSARAVLGQVGVGWMPEGGGLLGNLPAWENLLLSTQWHAPAALPALESRLSAWMAGLGYDAEGTRLLLSQQPSRLAEEDRLLVGWLRLLLARPKLVLLAGHALPAGAPGQRLLALIDEELADLALLVIDDEAPAGFIPLSIAAHEASVP